MPPLFADASGFEYWSKVIGLFVAIVTLGWGTLTFLKLWRDRKLAIADRFVGRWEWTIDNQVLDVCFKPDSTWEGRIIAGKGIVGTLFGWFSGSRITGTWFIATSAGRTVTVRDASGKFHVEDRIKKMKKDRIQLAAKGDLIRVPAAADVEAAKVAEAAAAAAELPPPLPPDAKSA